MDILKPRWSSTSLLLYAGAGIALVATLALVDALASGDGGRFGWAVLALVVAAGLALVFERNAWRIPAGLLAFVAVVLFALAFSLLEEWIGWHPNASGFTFSKFLLLVVVMVAALVALRRFRFPLLTVIVAGVAWELVIELFESSGPNWVASISVLVGLILLGVALLVDTSSRPYGFWLHVVAGLAIAGALLWWWHSTGLDWIWITLVALVFIAVGSRWERSSWAVLGLLLGIGAATHFINEWSRSFSVAPGLVPSIGSDNSAPGWARPLGYVLLGLLILAIGLALERRRGGASRS
jgi:hypothetical protein